MKTGGAAVTIKDVFYNWLARKYGWSEETFKSLDEEFRTSLLQEFNEIRRSFGQEIALMCEVFQADQTTQ